jgi:hypothetical protein
MILRLDFLRILGAELRGISWLIERIWLSPNPAIEKSRFVREGRRTVVV